MAMGNHYGSFAGGFINAYLQARRLRMQQAYYEARIADMEAARKGNTGDTSIFNAGRGNAQGLGGGSNTGSTARGVRNNNPGNLRDGDFAKSQPGYAGVDDRGFAKFDSVEHGTGALDGLLTKNYSGMTLRQIFAKYAPASDHNNPDAYASTVAKHLGIDVDSVPNLKDQDMLNGLRHSIVSVEQGIPYERVPAYLAGGGQGDSGDGSRPPLIDASDKVNASGGADATQLHPAFANRVAELSDAAYKATGVKLSFNELHRTYEQQAEIRARHEAMPGGVAAHPAAQAGHSNHEIGAAGDMDDNAAARWARTPGPDGVRPIDRVGLETLPGETGRNDPFHIQLPSRDLGKTAQADTGQGYQVAGDNAPALSPAAAARARASLAAHRVNPPVDPTQQGPESPFMPPDQNIYNTRPLSPSDRPSSGVGASAIGPRQGPFTREQTEERRRELVNTQLAPPGPDQTGQYGVNAVSQFAHLPNAPQPPAPRQDNITPPLDNRQSDPRAVPQSDSREFGPRQQAPYDPKWNSIESQPTFPPVQNREVGPENVGQRAWTPDSQPPFPPVGIPRSPASTSSQSSTSSQGGGYSPQLATTNFDPRTTPYAPPPQSSTSSQGGGYPPVTYPRPMQPPSTGRMPVDNSPAARNMPFVGETARTGQYDPRGVYAPKPPVRTPASNPNAPSRNAQPAVMLRPTPRAIPAPTDNGRFVQVTAPNSNPTDRNRPQMSALNLAGLFGGQGQAAPPVAPRPQFQVPPAPAPRPMYRQPTQSMVNPDGSTRVSVGLNPSGNLVLNQPGQPVRSVPVPYPPTGRPPPQPDTAPPSDVATPNVAPDNTSVTPPAAQSSMAMNTAIPPRPGMDDDMSDMRQMDQDWDSGMNGMAARRGGAVRYYRGGTVRRL